MKTVRRSITMLLAAVTLGVSLSGMAAAEPGPASPAIDWAECPESPAADGAARRLECGNVTVPLDHAEPEGRTVTIAVSRLTAVDPDRRRGVLLLNWGGPGWSGRKLPAYLADESRAGGLAEHYDLIGFDPRGTGASTGFSCQLPAPFTPDPGLPAKEQAAREAAAYGADLGRCGNEDPVFASNLTTQNVARDMDRIRVALGEQRISYLGVSWGTALGATYRTMFADRVDRMLLDSVTNPTFSFTAADLVPDMEQAFRVYSSWLARHDDRYHLGGRPAQVRTRLLALREQVRAEPFSFEGGQITGDQIAVFAVWFSNSWPVTSRLLAGIAAGDRAAVAAAYAEFAAASDWPSTDHRERFSTPMNLATYCNADTTSRDFDQVWAIQERQVSRFPMAGPMSLRYSECTGWPHSPQPLALQRRPGSLQLVAHTHEWNTPVRMAIEMQQTIGGTLGYVDDDVHGSLNNTTCAENGVRYLVTGRTFTSHCQPD